MSVKVDMIGFEEAVRKAREFQSKTLVKAIRYAVRKTTLDVRDAARGSIPNDTGTLRSNFGGGLAKSGPTQPQVGFLKFFRRNAKRGSKPRERVVNGQASESVRTYENDPYYWRFLNDGFRARDGSQVNKHKGFMDRAIQSAGNIGRIDAEFKKNFIRGIQLADANFLKARGQVKKTRGT